MTIIDALIEVGLGAVALAGWSRPARTAMDASFQHAVDHAPIMCWMADAGGSLFWYNQQWYDYTGKTAEEMKGWGWQGVHHPRALPSVVARWTECIDGGKPFSMVFPLRKHDGTYRLFLTRAQPSDDDANVRSWFGVNTEITDLEVEEYMRAAGI